ncbi:MAG: hydroxymethylbilane synthase [Rhodothermales bacterium]|jgi:hydroxymethylbilane synthase
MVERTVRAGTRTSRLAVWQTDHVLAGLTAAWPSLRVEATPFNTKGDQILDTPLPEIGGKGLFTAELESAIRAGAIDMAVHSLKDLPTSSPPGIVVASVLNRAEPLDALVSRNGQGLMDLPPGAVVGTSSTRRAAQVLKHRPDLQIRSIRGNVPTRLQKVMDGLYDASILAVAGLVRLGLGEAITERFRPEVMLPAPGQGAIGVQCREDDRELRGVLAAIEDDEARSTTTAERAFLAGLQAGCSSPVGAYARLAGDVLRLEGIVLSLDGRKEIQVRGEGRDPAALGKSLAAEALARGAAGLINA